MRRGTVVVVALLAGLAIGRFATFEPATPPVAAPTASRTPEDRVAGLERAVEAEPGDLTSWQRLGIAYTQRAFEVGDPAFYDLAARALDRADDLQPEHPETLLARGNLALALHDFGAAREYGRRVRQSRPHSADALGVLVDAEIELGDYDAAREHLQAMLDLRPSLPALARTSYLRELHGDLAGAIEAMQRAEAAGSGSAFDVATVSALLGDLHVARGELDAAQASYRRALDAAPDLVTGAVGLARVEAATGRTRAAIERVEGVVERFPQPAAVILLADLYRWSGEEEKARQSDALVRTIARLQEDAGQNIDLELALFEADRGDRPERALERAQKAFDARPANVYAADTLAWALLRAGRAEEAAPRMEQALRLGTADALVRYHAAEVFAAVGDVDRARAELTAALAANPAFSVAHREPAADLAQRIGVALPAAWENGR